MNTQWTAGVDWGRRRHHVCVMDQRGRVVKERAFKHGGKGLPTGLRGIADLGGPRLKVDVLDAVEFQHRSQ